MNKFLNALLVSVFIGSTAFAGGFMGQVKVWETGEPAGYARVYVLNSNPSQDCGILYGDYGCNAQGGFNTGPDMDAGYYWLHAVWYDEEKNKYESWWWGYYSSGWQEIGIIWIYQDYPCPC